MSYPTPTINVANGDVFQKVFDTINLFSNLFTYSVMTTNSSANGATTNGNAWVNGNIATLKLFVGSLSGGNLAVSNTLVVTSNVTVGNASIYQNGAASFTTITVPSITVANGITVGNAAISQNGSGSFISVSALSVTVGNASISQNGTASFTTVTAANVTVGTAAITTVAATNITVGNTVTIGNSSISQNGTATFTTLVAANAAIGSASFTYVTTPNINVGNNIFVGNTVIVGNSSISQNGSAVFTTLTVANLVSTNTISVGSSTLYQNGTASFTSVIIGSTITTNGVPYALSNSSVGVLVSSNTVGRRGAVNFNAGLGIVVTASDDATDGQVNVTIALASNSSSNVVAVSSVAGIGGPNVSTSNLQIALGLGVAAYLPVGNTANTVAAGNDARITGAAQLAGAIFTGKVTLIPVSPSDNSNTAATTAMVQNVVSTSANTLQSQINSNSTSISSLVNTANNIQAQVNTNSVAISYLANTTSNIQAQVNANSNNITTLQSAASYLLCISM